MIRPALLSEPLLRRLNLAVAVAGGVIALAAGALAIGLLMANTAVSEARADQTAAMERERAAQETIAKAAKVPVRKVAARMDQQIEAFGSRLAEICKSENVTFSTFDNSGEAAPFTTRYTGTIEGKDWKASEARVTIRGDLADIYTVLGKLRGHAIPFEVVTGTFDGGSDDGEVRVGLTIAAIVREENVAGRG